MIRAYRPEDRERVLSIWHEASRVGHPFLTEEDLANQRKLVETVYLPMAEMWVAEENDSLSGFIGLLGNHIGGLFVAPDFHGRGVGRALVEHAFRLKGPLSVDVYADNRAQGFYRRLGFVETARIPHDDEGRPFPLLAMRKER